MAHRLLSHGERSTSFTVRSEHNAWRWFLDKWSEEGQFWIRESTSLQLLHFDEAVTQAKFLRDRAAEHAPHELEDHRWGVEKVKTTTEVVQMREVT